MTPSIEVLVHVSGPSRGQDDARYRREAQGFLDFSPVERHYLPEIEEEEHLTSKVTEIPTLSQWLNSGTTGSSITTLPPTQRLEAIQELFHTRIYDSTPTRTSVRVDALRTPAVTAAATTISSPVLPWTSIKETPHLLVEQTPAPPRPHSALNHKAPSRQPRSFGRTQSDSRETPPSVIPDSQPFPSSSCHQISSPILKRPLSSSFSSEDRHTTPSTKRLRRRSPSPLPSSSFPIPASSPANAQEHPPLGESSSQRSLVNEQVSDIKLPLEIHPKMPEVGNQKLMTTLTTPLIELSNAPKMKALQIECILSRPVGPLERGHWHVSLGTWTRTAKEDMWRFLTDFIGRGKAGWNVWCVRELENKASAASDSSDKENKAPPVQEEVLRVFCWGEIIREVFLVLFVAGVNDKKNKGAGQAKWVDSGQKIVGTVKGRYLQSS